MAKEPYVQLSAKFPTRKERYRQAVDLVTERDKGIYPTQADYLTAAILAFEGKLSDERTSLNQIMQEVLRIGRRVDEIYDDEKKRNHEV